MVTHHKGMRTILERNLILVLVASAISFTCSWRWKNMTMLPMMKMVLRTCRFCISKLTCICARSPPHLLKKHQIMWNPKHKVGKKSYPPAHPRCQSGRQIQSLPRSRSTGEIRIRIRIFPHLCWSSFRVLFLQLLASPRGSKTKIKLLLFSFLQRTL